MNEIWKPVPSLEGTLASSLGRIKFPEVTSITPNGGQRVHKTKPQYGVTKRGTKTKSYKYKAIYHSRFGNVAVHRAVCEAFHGPAPFEGAIVMHLDDDALNNRPENLQWATQKENANMPGLKAYHRSRVGERSAWAKHKEQVDREKSS